jgi:hypothetical protein
MFIVSPRSGVTDALDQISSIMLHVVLHIYLFPGLFFLTLLGPRLPILSVLHQLFIIMNTQSRHPLSFRSIAHLDDIEAQELAGKLGLSP